MCLVWGGVKVFFFDFFKQAAELLFLACLAGREEPLNQLWSGKGPLNISGPNKDQFHC